MYLRSSEVGLSSKTCETVSTFGVCTLPAARILSARQTIDELSRPPLNSANTGRSDRRRQRTASSKRVKPCSRYCSSVRYRMRLQGSSCQNGSVDSSPFEVTVTKWAGLVKTMFLKGVRSPVEVRLSAPSINSSSSSYEPMKLSNAV